MFTHKGIKRLASLRFLRNRVLVTIFALVLGLTLLTAFVPSPAFSQSAPLVLGKTIGQWSAAWWQWISKIPRDSNPLLDDTGQFSGVNQAGPVWFLAGTPGFWGPVTREVTVPAGKSIFFPILFIAIPKSPGDPETESSIRTRLNDFATPLGGDVVSTLDGVPTVFNPSTPTVRTQSPVFALENVPDDNIFGETIPAGSIGISDGFWVMLPPLKPGSHVLQFGVAFGAEDVTFKLTVK